MAQDALLKNAEIMAEIEARNPEIVLPSGSITQGTVGSIFQSKDDSKMSATFAIVTRTPTPNRYGNQLQMLPNANGRGPVTQYYDANPVVLYDHGMSGCTLPIGQSKENGNLALGFFPDKILGTGFFSDRPWAEPIYAAVSDGLLRMASIGFDPILGMRLKPAQPMQAAAPDGVQDFTYLGMDFTEWELLEWSVVPIGADRGALRQCLDRGSINGIKLPVFLKQSFSRYAAEVQRLGIGMDFKPPEQQRINVDSAEYKAGFESGKNAGIAEQLAKAPACGSCGGSLKCTQCEKQMDDEEDIQTVSEPDPDIAPDMSADYALQVAQHCAAQLHQSHANEIQRVVLQGVTASVKEAVQPLVAQIQGAAQEFDRMLGKVKQNG